MGNKNVLFKHTLKDYEKKFHHRANLMKVSKKEVEDFDKITGLTGEHYLLRKHKWWLIGDTYYQVPKPLGHYWFRNLNAGAKTAICLLGAGIVATGASMPYILKLINVAEPEVSIESSDKVTWSNKHYDKDGNACLTIKGKGENVISKVEVNIENYKCIENTDYTYDTSNGNLVVKKACIDAHPGKIDINPVFKKQEKEYEISLSETSKSLNIEEDFTLTATITEKSNEDPTLNWEITGENPDSIILTKISNTQYKVTAKKVGNCKVSVSCTGGNTVECSITVTSEPVVEALEYHYNDTTQSYEVCCEHAKRGEVTSATIPATYNDGTHGEKNVTGLYYNSGTSYGAFGGCSKLKTVSLPNTITSIGMKAFYLCSELSTINIPNGVTEIGEKAFKKCNALKSITIPSSVTRIGDECFNESNLTDGVTFDSNSNLEYIGDSSFAYTSISSISLPSTVKTLEFGCFKYCPNLTSITIPSAVEFIGRQSMTATGLTAEGITFEDNESTWQIWQNPAGWVTDYEFKPNDNKSQALTYLTAANAPDYKWNRNAITVTSDSETVAVNGTLQLTSSESDVTWTSSNTSKATVDSSGLVTGKSICDEVVIKVKKGNIVGFKKLKVVKAVTSIKVFDESGNEITGTQTLKVGKTLKVKIKDQDNNDVTSECTGNQGDYLKTEYKDEYFIVTALKATTGTASSVFTHTASGKEASIIFIVEELKEIPVSYNETSEVAGLSFSGISGKTLKEEDFVTVAVIGPKSQEVTFNLVGKVNDNEVYRADNKTFTEEFSIQIGSNDIKDFSSLTKSDTIIFSIEKATNKIPLEYIGQDIPGSGKLTFNNTKESIEDTETSLTVYFTYTDYSSGKCHANLYLCTDSSNPSKSVISYPAIEIEKKTSHTFSIDSKKLSEISKLYVVATIDK